MMSKKLRFRVKFFKNAIFSSEIYLNQSLPVETRFNPEAMVFLVEGNIGKGPKWHYVVKNRKNSEFFTPLSVL